jgi:hypothetical protein
MAALACVVPVVGGLDSDSREALNYPDRFRVNGRLTGGHSGTLIICR